MENQKNPVLCIIQSKRDENWNREKPYQEQEGIEEHLQYMAKLHEEGIMIYSGPFLDNTGLFSILISKEDKENLQKLIDKDPAVKTRLVKSSVRHILTPFPIKAELRVNVEGKPVIMHLVTYSPGEKWVEGLSIEEQAFFLEHVHYCNSLYKLDKILLGGPFAETHGEQFVFYTQQQAEVNSIVENDPAVRNQILSYEIKPWVSLFQMEYDS